MGKTQGRKIRYAQVGVGGRSHMFSEAIVESYSGTSELVALCDTNPGRLKLRFDWAAGRGVSVKTYPAEQFDTMINENEIDVVIVTTKDCDHDSYICRAMELGCDVITEKPMTTDERKCRRILDTQKQTGKSCRVTFNYRYSPPRSQLKDLLMSGVIGKVLSVDFHWMLNTRHGADYFRRWHRNKENSGGLMVHKATHHFDLVNWWLSTVPESVQALGKRKFYVPETKALYGLTNTGMRCSDCPEIKRCPFALDFEALPKLQEMYREQEQYDGYYRDRCVFSDEIDIEDTMHVMVSYRNGATMSYSLHAFMPWEGYTISFNGTHGRIEHICQESVYVSGDGTVPGELIPDGTRTKVYPHFLPPYEVDIWKASGGHGGADPVMLADIFGKTAEQDPYLRAADQRAGAWSIMTGIAANHAFQTGCAVNIADLVGSIDEPDYPPMPETLAPYSAEKMERILQAQNQRAGKMV